MNDIELLAFVIVPLTALAFGWALAVWARRDAERGASDRPGAAE